MVKLWLQVELSCSSGSLDISYVVSLYPTSVATAVIVKNKGPKAVTLSNAILSHFKFKRRNGAAIQGLKTCSFSSQPPLSSPFELLSPAEAMKSDPSPDWFPFGAEPEDKPGVWTKQDVPYIILKNKLSRVYAAPPEERLKAFYNTPPSKYEILDQVQQHNTNPLSNFFFFYFYFLNEQIYKCVTYFVGQVQFCVFSC